MPLFTVRVVLHNVVRLDQPVYDRLHKIMEEARFVRFIQGANDQKWYHLPPAEYIYQGAKTALQVHDLAKGAAALVDSNFGIVVTEGPQTFSGLKPLAPH